MQHSETILSLQYFKLVWQCDEISEEWMGFLGVKAPGHKYKDKDSCLKEQSINGINDKGKMANIIKEINVINIVEVISGQVLSLAKWIEAQRSQKAM